MTKSLDQFTRLVDVGLNSDFAEANCLSAQGRTDAQGKFDTPLWSPRPSAYSASPGTSTPAGACRNATSTPPAASSRAACTASSGTGDKKDKMRSIKMSDKRRCRHKPAKPVAAYPVNIQGRLGVQDAAGMAAPLACSRPYGGQLDMDLERVRDDFPLSTCPGTLVLKGLCVFVTGEFCRAQSGRIGTIRTHSNRNPRITLPWRWYRNPPMTSSTPRPINAVTRYTCPRLKAS